MKIETRIEMMHKLLLAAVIRTRFGSEQMDVMVEKSRHLPASLTMDETALNEIARRFRLKLECLPNTADPSYVLWSAVAEPA